MKRKDAHVWLNFTEAAHSMQVMGTKEYRQMVSKDLN